MESAFYIAQRCLVFTVYPHRKVTIDEDALKKELRDKKLLLARYYTESQLVTPPINPSPEDSSPESEKTNVHWWHCLRQEPIELDRLTAKQRYRVRKGLKNNEIWLATREEIIGNADELYGAYSESLKDYPSVYKINPQRAIIDSLAVLAQTNGQDIWLIKDRNDDKIIGFAHWCIVDSAIAMSSVKIRPQYLNNEANAALGFVLCDYYLNQNNYLYVCDGERNIRHITNYQDFLVRVLGFKKIPCKLHVVYNPLIRPIISALYPFRGFIARIEKMNSYVYNLSCVLKQEEIARKCNS